MYNYENFDLHNDSDDIVMSAITRSLSFIGVEGTNKKIENWKRNHIF